MERKSVWMAVAGILMVLLVLPYTATYGADPSKKEIRIGIPLPYTGVYASLGRDLTNGFSLYLEQIGNKVAGYQIRLEQKDTKGEPATGITKTRELIEKDKVDLLAGYVHSGVVLGARDYIESQKIPTIVTNASARDITQRKKSPYIFRTAVAGGTQELAGGWYLYNKLKIKKVILIFPDYVMGREGADGFKKLFVSSGGQIVKELWPALGTADYSPLLALIAENAKDADATIAGFAGADIVRFVTQYAEYGLNKKIPLYVWGDGVDESLLPAQGDSPVGLGFYATYVSTIDNGENRNFVETYRKKYGVTPGMYCEKGYAGAMAMVAGLNAVKGDLSNVPRFLDALRRVRLDLPRGPFRFDEDQNSVSPIYIGKMEKIGGKVRAVIQDMIPDVGQHWSGPK